MLRYNTGFGRDRQVCDMKIPSRVKRYNELEKKTLIFSFVRLVPS